MIDGDPWSVKKLFRKNETKPKIFSDSQNIIFSDSQNISANLKQPNVKKKQKTSSPKGNDRSPDNKQVFLNSYSSK